MNQILFILMSEEERFDTLVEMLGENHLTSTQFIEGVFENLKIHEGHPWGLSLDPQDFDLGGDKKVSFDYKRALDMRIANDEEIKSWFAVLGENPNNSRNLIVFRYGEGTETKITTGNIGEEIIRRVNDPNFSRTVLYCVENDQICVDSWFNRVFYEKLKKEIDNAIKIHPRYDEEVLIKRPRYNSDHLDSVSGVVSDLMRHH